MTGVQGQDAVFTVQVMAGTQPAKPGLVYITVDGTVVGDPSVTADGTASVTVKDGLALGSHQVQANYSAGSG